MDMNYETTEVFIIYTLKNKLHSFKEYIYKEKE